MCLIYADCFADFSGLSLQTANGTIVKDEYSATSGSASTGSASGIEVDSQAGTPPQYGGRWNCVQNESVAKHYEFSRCNWALLRFYIVLFLELHLIQFMVKVGVLNYIGFPWFEIELV